MRKGEKYTEMIARMRKSAEIDGKMWIIHYLCNEVFYNLSLKLSYRKQQAHDIHDQRNSH